MSTTMLNIISCVQRTINGDVSIVSPFIHQLLTLPPRYHQIHIRVDWWRDLHRVQIHTVQIKT